MDQVRLIIIEDELHNSRMLAGMVKKLRPEWHVEAVLESVEESVEWLNNHPHPHLILLDIQLSDGLSFSILKKVELGLNTHLIFTTAYDEYAIRAFKVNSLDYLLKPIKEEELEFSFAKFESHNENGEGVPMLFEEQEHYKQLVQSILRGKKEYRSRFLINGVKDFVKVNTKEIAFFYSSNKMTFAHCFDGGEHVLDYTLEQLEDELDPAFFFRANRQSILNIEAVKKVSNVSGSKLQVITQPSSDVELIVSRLKAHDFKKWLGK